MAAPRGRSSRPACPRGDKGRIGLVALRRRSKGRLRDDRGTTRRDSGIYRTLDAGATWEKTSSLNARPNYYSQIRIDPRDRDWIYTLGSNRGFYFSNDGGKNFTELFSNVHGEDHALWIDPANTNHLIIGGDGGVSDLVGSGQDLGFPPQHAHRPVL